MTAIRLGPPAKQGLYDPQFEHDACGVGFVVDIKGRKSNAVVKQGIQILKNLDHRGASGSEVNTGDGAGILHADAARLPQEGGEERRAHQPARARPVRRRQHLHAAQRDAAPQDRRSVRARGAGRRARSTSARAACPPTTPSLGETAKASEPFVRQVFIGRGAGDARRGGVRAQALRDPQARVQRDPRVDHRRRGVLVHRVAVAQDAGLQGHAHHDAARPVLPRPAEPADGDRDRAGALALLHQHLPELGSRAPVPLHRAQRRDQHAARQHQLDARARGAVPVAGVRRRHQEDPAHHQSERLGLLDVRQRARAHGALRPLDAARRHDDDPRAVVQARLDGSGAPRVLPVPQ